MERLTVKYINTLRTGVSVLSAINKLTDYENKEEKGLLLKLPCNIGDTVYAYCDEFGILTYTVNYIIIDEHKHISAVLILNLLEIVRVNASMKSNQILQILVKQYS